ncbi:MAG: type 1 glutamine amidotransferase domain-containing protein [Nannocystaceae bacterium]
MDTRLGCHHSDDRALTPTCRRPTRSLADEPPRSFPRRRAAALVPSPTSRRPTRPPRRRAGYSDPEHESGYSADDLISLGFKRSPRHRGLLADTRGLDDVDPGAYDAIFLAGGQSPMFTFRGDAGLARLVAAFYEAGKVTALVCHATCLLLDLRLASGARLVEGKSWTGFADAEERFADAVVGRRLQPFWIESEARRIEGTHFLVDQAFRPFAVRDGLLVTGQQQFSGAAAARLVIEALGR